MKLQENFGKCCLFLHPDASTLLNPIYDMLGAKANHSFPEFYKEYVLPHFDIFSRNCQIGFLNHIKNLVLPMSTSEQDFLNYIRSTPCNPDETGNLHCASFFHDPCNEVFKVMFDSSTSKFPSDPFNEAEWLKFLIKIGLKRDIDEAQFLDFCREVESIASKSQGDETNANRSKVLVQYLLDKAHLRDLFFLSSVSNIKFITPEKVENDLLTLHKQHQCDDADVKLQYVQFRDSVPWEHRKLVWTSAQILPLWAQPSFASDLASHLGVLAEPSVETVVIHLEIICSSLPKALEEADALPPRRRLKEILMSIYDFLEQSSKYPVKEVSDGCSWGCQTIVSHLKCIPCILLDDENSRALVKGEQMSFTVPRERSLSPFFYPVPREYCAYQHFLKRLGATEEVTPFQMANVLKAIKDCCQDEWMSPNDELKARHAMFFFFKSLVSDCDETASEISKLTELYLPSESKFLIKSSELVCKVPPRLTKAVSKLEHHVLFPLVECGLSRAQGGVYLEALPEHLRPVPFEDLVREEMDPACVNETCLYGKGNCSFIEKYILVLRSTQFWQGIIRLIKHYRKSDELTDEEKEKAGRLGSSKVAIKCMKTINSHLVDVKTQTPLEGSSCERTCYVVKESKSWTLYIQHEFGGNKTQAILSKSVNEVMEGLLDESCMAELTDMLSCDAPSQIAGVLSAHDISHDFSEEDEELGREVPVVYHYLILQNPLCTFDKGARVAYGVDTKEEEEEEEDWREEDEGATTKYILAKIISKSIQDGQAYVSKSILSGQAYDFEAEYMIDLGSKSKAIRASVLDLYKYQDDIKENLVSGVVMQNNVDVDKEKEKIREVLLIAGNLPLKIRRKVLRRLYLHWLQSKSSGNAEVVTQIIEFLISMVKAMEDETDGSVWCGPSLRFFQRCKRRARREKVTFGNFQSSFSGSMRFFPESSDYANPKPKEASRWIEQSQADLEAAKFLYSPASRFHALVCFLSEQVVEKCLKATLYAKCGLQQEQLHTHDVIRLADHVNRLHKAPRKVVERAVSVANYYLPTRYPNRQPFDKVPAKEFSKEQAEEALKIADELLKSIKTFVNS